MQNKKIFKEAFEEAGDLANLSQFIQMRIWEYTDIPQKKRKAMNVADVIIKECFKVFKKTNL